LDVIPFEVAWALTLAELTPTRHELGVPSAKRKQGAKPTKAARKLSDADLDQLIEEPSRSMSRRAGTGRASGGLCRGASQHVRRAALAKIDRRRRRRHV